MEVMNANAIVRIDDLYINLNNVTRIEVLDPHGTVEISFLGVSDGDIGAWRDSVTLTAERGIRFLQWLARNGKIGVA